MYQHNDFSFELKTFFESLRDVDINAINYSFRQSNASLAIGLVLEAFVTAFIQTDTKVRIGNCRRLF